MKNSIKVISFLKKEMKLNINKFQKNKMEFYPNQDDKGYHLNPHNKFLLIFCHAYDVGEG